MSHHGVNLFFLFENDFAKNTVQVDKMASKTSGFYRNMEIQEVSKYRDKEIKKYR